MDCLLGPPERSRDWEGVPMESRSRENAALVREFLTDVLAGEDIEALDIFLTETAVDHHPVLDEAAPDLPSRGPTVCRVLGAADVDITVDTVIADGDMVAARGTVMGDQRPSLVDVAPSGRTFEISYAWFCRIERGRIAEIWSLPDGQRLRREFGQYCTPGDTEETDQQ